MKIYFKIAFLLFSLVASGCAPAEYDASFKGKVIDLYTYEPIEGAVALAIWTTWLLGAGGEVDNYYDAVEAITDKDGNFFIQGKGTRVMTNLNPMQVTVFKAGYSASSGTIKSYSQDKWNRNTKDGRLIIYLQELTKEQRKKSGGMGPLPDEAPLEKIRNFLIEMDKVRIEEGYPPIREWNGEIYLDQEKIKKIKQTISQYKVKEEIIPQYKGPCKLTFRVYQENGEWKKEDFPEGFVDRRLGDPRPECIEKEEEMKRLYKEHIWKKDS